VNEVIACSYLGISHPDPEEWRTFAAAGLGAEVAPESDDERLLLRIDQRAWRFWIEKGEKALRFVGWEVASDSALESLVDRLRKNDVAVDLRPDLAEERGVERLAVATDPGGVRLEFFHTAASTTRPFVSPTATRFVTSDKMPGDMGFGHIVIAYHDAAKAAEFYLGLLGFRLSDKSLEPDGSTWWFAHVNPRHHSLAFGPGPVDGELHHFMLEVETIDQVGEALDRLTDLGAPIVAGLGRHSNDKMLSFYVRTPNGFELEYGYAGLKIDDHSWSPVLHSSGSNWGHRPTNS
jgi:3,4-dihydroxy-9,10-secoandrosta-1,3,5(10)-triene-9,17-dione 4,5-dioxygenase